MTDFSRYQHFAPLFGAEHYLLEPDILFIIPPKGYFDSPKQAPESAELQVVCVRKLGKPCGDIIVMSRTKIPIKLFGTVEKGIGGLSTIRPE